MFHLEGITPNSFKMTKIVNPDDESDCLLFDGKGFSGSSFRARDRNGEICVYGEINEFIATKLTQSDRANLFKAYSDVDEYFNNSNQIRRKSGSIVDTFDSGLSKKLEKIIEIIEFKKVKDFLLDKYKKGEIKIPDDIGDKYNIDGKMQQKHLDCTYLKSDYLDAIAMCLYLRTMIPIWGRYLPITRFENKHHLKEYYALKLISGTKLFKEHTFSRLDTYIRGTVNIEDDISIMVSGLSKEEIPFVLMSQIVVKRFPIFAISATAEGDRVTHLMSMMFHLIGDSGKVGRLGNLLKKPIFEKKAIDTEWSDEDNSSVLDMYKSRELIPGGDLAISEVFLTDYCQGDDSELTELCWEYTKDIDLKKITPVQIRLMTWVVAVLVPGNAVPLFDAPVLRRALAIVQSQLYSWGFKDLAIMLTAIPVELEEGTFVTHLGQKNISNDRKMALDKVYGLDSNIDSKIENVGIKAIQSMSREFFDSDWGVNCPKKLYEHDEDLVISPIFSTHGELRNMLADLLVKLSRD